MLLYDFSGATSAPKDLYGTSRLFLTHHKQS
jgi:hypothetical protein